MCACVESVAEYCRIVYDVFPDNQSSGVCVVSAAKKEVVHNTWHPYYQSSQKVCVVCVCVYVYVSVFLCELDVYTSVW